MIRFMSYLVAHDLAFLLLPFVPLLRWQQRRGIRRVIQSMGQMADVIETALLRSERRQYIPR